MREIGFVLADTHAGNKLGLMSPGTSIDIEMPNGEIRKQILDLNPVQLYISDILDWLTEFAIGYSAGDRVTLIHNGDLTQGNRYGNLESPSENLQAIIARRNIGRLLDAVPNITTVRIIKGTGAHVFENGDSENLVASFLKEEYPNRHILSVFHDLITINGVVCDIAHHGPVTGRRIWLEGNEARFYLRNIIMNELIAGKIPPRLVLRAHYHTYVKESISLLVDDKEHDSTIVVCPSLCVLDDYARKVVKSPYKITLGGLFFEVIDGRLTDVKVMVKSLDVRTKENPHGLETSSR